MAALISRRFAEESVQFLGKKVSIETSDNKTYSGVLTGLNEKFDLILDHVDYHLIVAVTTENFDDARGKLNVRQSLMDRIRNVQRSGLADEVIIEEYEGQKVTDIQKHHVDIFAIGSDWLGKFDYLNDYCKVVYLDRTKGVSSTQLRNASGMLRLGVVGSGRIANRLVDEARFVSGVSSKASGHRAQQRPPSPTSTSSLVAGSSDELLDEVDAVYVAAPHGAHAEFATEAMEAASTCSARSR